MKRSTIVAGTLVAIFIIFIAGVATGVLITEKSPRINTVEEWQALSRDRKHPDTLVAWIDSTDVIQQEFATQQHKK